MSELIAKLEAADGPSFMLEVELHRWRFPDADEMSIPNNYTSSIDAALTLVGDHSGYELTGYTADEQAECIVWDIDLARDTYIAVASTPALAICIAALKARTDA